MSTPVVTVKRDKESERTYITLADDFHGDKEKRGHIALEDNGEIHFSPDGCNGRGHFWITPEDGEGWTALQAHMNKFAAVSAPKPPQIVTGAGATDELNNFALR